MKKEDELKFMELILNNHREKKKKKKGEPEKGLTEIIEDFKSGKRRKTKTIREVISDCDISNKRCCYYLEKWAGKNWFDCGVSIVSGWVTEKGEKEMAEFLERAVEF